VNHSWVDSIVSDAEPSPEALAHLVRGLRIWWRQGRADDLTLARCLDLPERPSVARAAVRDEWLRKAATYLQAPAREPWRQARELHAEVQRFAGRKWPCWADCESAPTTASPLEAALFRAFRASGGSMPATVRRLHQILGER